MKLMKSRFDRQIEQQFKENLEPVHASDDLIARTLLRVKEEQDKLGLTEEEDNSPVSSLSAIDPTYITKHINRKTRKSKITVIAASVAAAAAVILVSGMILNRFVFKNSDRLSNVRESVTGLEESSVVTAGEQTVSEEASGVTALSSNTVYSYNNNYYLSRGMRNNTYDRLNYNDGRMPERPEI